MVFSKTIEIINVGTPVEVRTGKTPYKTIEIAFKSEGKVEGKKLVSFSNEQVFKQVQELKQGDIVTIELEKDKNGYWQWTSISMAGTETTGGTPTSETQSPTVQTNKNVSGRVTGSNYETPEERKNKQLNIVRQFSINAALKFYELRKEKCSIGDIKELAEDLVGFVYQTDPVQKLVNMTDDIPL